MLHRLGLQSMMVVLNILLLGVFDNVTGYGSGYETAWLPWSSWSTCSSTCGEGERQRTRTCTIPPSSYNSRPCNGSDHETEKCHQSACPVNDCKDVWSNCPDYESSCASYEYVMNNCQLTCGECIGIITKAGGWSSWTSWSSCSASCGTGHRQRTRSCTNPPTPPGGGKPCTGQEADIEPCKPNGCPINGGWSPWSSWTSCSATCGKGLRHRNRYCNNPPTSTAGEHCTGPADDTEACNQNACPVNDCKNVFPSCHEYTDYCDNPEIKKNCAKTCGGCEVDCKNVFPSCHEYTDYCDNPEIKKNCAKTCGGCEEVGAWLPWSSWSTCSSTCGEGERQRTRLCTIPPSPFNSRPCNGSDHETEKCQQITCPVNGAWLPWSSWSTCSSTCGEGERQRTRTCTIPPSPNNRRPCNGSDHETEKCQQSACPVNGGWSPWSSWTSCATTCGEGLRHRNRYCNNPPPSSAGEHCTGPADDTETCNQNACPVNGEWSSWSSWAYCTDTCGGGQRKRTRLCNNPPPSAGGRQCQGRRDDIETCNQNACPILGSCHIDGVAYPPGTEWQKNCIRYYCEEGLFYSRNVYNKQCGVCKCHNDPHFITYDNVKFDWHGQSTYVISQEGTADCPDVFVNAKFKNCAKGPRGATCVDTFFYKTENSPILKIIKDDRNVENSQIIIDGYSQKLRKNNNGALQILKGPNGKEYPVLGQVQKYKKQPCIHIFGFDNTGFNIKICSYGLTIFTHPKLKNNLYGLCGDWNNNAKNDLKLRNGAVIQPPKRTGGGFFGLFRKVNKNVNQKYGNDWEVKECPKVSFGAVGRQGEIPDNSCDSTEGELKEYERACKSKVASKHSHLTDIELEDIIEECIFDRCIAYKTGNESIIADWLDQSGGKVDQKQMEKDNTVDEGSCFMNGGIYPAGTEWENNCITYRCENGKFYSNKKYNNRCGSCLVNNDPHFTTYDGVRFDWHGHSTYVISQQSSSACPDVFINSQFAECAVGHPDATCLHTIYFQPVAGTFIKIVKENPIQNSKISVNGHLQELDFESNGELHVLIGVNSTKQLAFGWIDNNCLYFTGFNIDGYTIKICNRNLKIYAHPSQQNQLYGLCGDWNNEANEDLKMRNGRIITAPSGGGFTRQQVNPQFGQDWEVDVACSTNADCVINNDMVKETACTANETDVIRYRETCRQALTPLQIDLSMEKLNGIIDECAFDQCIAEQSGNDGINTEWLNQCIEFVKEEEEELKNTVVGRCKAGYEQVGFQCLYFATSAKHEAKLSWIDAAHRCHEKGGQLAVLEEPKILIGYTRTNYRHDHFWVGLTDVEVEGDFRWTNGVKLQRDKHKKGFLPWARVLWKWQPDNRWGKEHCVVIGRSFGYKYNDGKCLNYKQHFICDDRKGNGILPGTFSTLMRIHDEHISWRSGKITVNGDYILFTAKGSDDKKRLVYIDNNRYTSLTKPVTLKICDLYRGAYDLGGGRRGLIYLLPPNGAKQLAGIKLFKIWKETDATLNAASLSRDNAQEANSRIAKAWKKILC